MAAGVYNKYIDNIRPVKAGPYPSGAAGMWGGVQWQIAGRNRSMMTPGGQTSAMPTSRRTTSFCPTISSFFIERWTSLSISIRQAKAFLQLVERHGLKPASPVILDLLQ